MKTLHQVEVPEFKGAKTTFQYFVGQIEEGDEKSSQIEWNVNTRYVKIEVGRFVIGMIKNGQVVVNSVSDDHDGCVQTIDRWGQSTTPDRSKTESKREWPSDGSVYAHPSYSYVKRIINDAGGRTVEDDPAFGGYSVQVIKYEGKTLYTIGFGGNANYRPHNWTKRMKFRLANADGSVLVKNGAQFVKINRNR